MPSRHWSLSPSSGFGDLREHVGLYSPCMLGFLHLDRANLGSWCFVAASCHHDVSSSDTMLEVILLLFSSHFHEYLFLPRSKRPFVTRSPQSEALVTVAAISTSVFTCHNWILHRRRRGDYICEWSGVSYHFPFPPLKRRSWLASTPPRKGRKSSLGQDGWVDEVIASETVQGAHVG